MAAEVPPNPQPPSGARPAGAGGARPLRLLAPLIGGLCRGSVQWLARAVPMATVNSERPRRRVPPAMAAYSPGVLVGNWSEDAALAEELLEDFRRKREAGELFTQRCQKLQDNLLKKVKLSLPKDGFVHFGDTVMLLSPDNNKSWMENYPGVCGKLVLAVNLDEVAMFTAESLRAPCGVSAVKSMDPVGRNTFCILSVDGGAVGEPIRFGQKFGLGATGGFSDQTANSNIIITHCHTNQSLAVPRNFCIRSYFGMEYEVVCHTYLNSHKAEEDKNYWVIVTGNPSDEESTMIDRPDPHSEGIRKKSDFHEKTQNIKIPD
ncbi:cilia- and flagella-associated protein 161 isoform X2 [Struthio camelus]|uniref:cilia- and flagella-associated protein 161 isoform X2 n=1 Tax=Struthio camelus TaxID=8801 RepID=UPI003603EEEE